MTANIIYQHFISPFITLPLINGEIKEYNYEPLTNSWPCELHLLNLRSASDYTDGKVKSDSLMLIHHQSTDCGLPAKGLTCATNDGKVSLHCKHCQD